jgi:hypothetical protein
MTAFQPARYYDILSEGLKVKIISSPSACLCSRLGCMRTYKTAVSIRKIINRFGARKEIHGHKLVSIFNIVEINIVTGNKRFFRIEKYEA